MKKVFKLHLGAPPGRVKATSVRKDMYKSEDAATAGASGVNP